MRRRRVLLIFVVSLALGGVGRHAFASDPAPEAGGLAVLNCELVIQSAEEARTSDAILEDVARGRTKPSGWRQPVGGGFISLVTPGSETVEGRIVGGLVVFEGLLPGRYRVSRVTTELDVKVKDTYSPDPDDPGDEPDFPGDYWQKGQVFEFGRDDPRAPEFDVAAGRLTYVGTLTIWGRCTCTIKDGMRRGAIGVAEHDDPCDWSCALRSDHKRERDAMRRLRQDYHRRPWTRLVSDRLRELETAPR